MIINEKIYKTLIVNDDLYDHQLDEMIKSLTLELRLEFPFLRLNPNIDIEIYTEILYAELLWNLNK